MSHEYHLLPRLWRWAVRFRRRCGYGVHSPLAFQFITGVVYSTDAYYAYEPLRRHLIASASRYDEYDPASGLTAKDLRLIFRLANYAEPAAVCLLGASPTVEAYVRAARTSAPLISDPASATFVYVDPSAVQPLPPALNLQPGSLVVVRSPHRSKASRDYWQTLCTAPEATLTFDLWRFGVAISRPKMTKQHYVVNYF